MLKELQATDPSAGALAPKDSGDGSARLQGDVSSKALPEIQDSIKNMSRSELISNMFSLLDISGSSMLSSTDLRRYAELTGFHGSDDDWTDQYDGICVHYGWDRNGGVSQAMFAELDETSDDDLRDALLELLRGPKSIRRSVSSTFRVQLPPSSAKLPQHSQLPPRSKLISDIFLVLDPLGSSRLLSAQLHRYAILSGFDGDDEDWAEEFKDLCESEGWNADEGVSQAEFAAFLADDSMGSDAEFQALLAELQRQNWHMTELDDGEEPRQRDGPDLT